MRRNAQAISEYLVLITLIAAALTVMQIYFRRSVQAVVKIAADEIGGQKEGAATEDLHLVWFEKDNTDVNSTMVSTKTETKFLQASVTRGIDETITQEGGISFGVSRQKE
jgi:hypothetical protein